MPPIRNRKRMTNQCVITGLPTTASNSLTVTHSCDPRKLPVGNYHYSLLDHLDACLPRHSDPPLYVELEKEYDDLKDDYVEKESERDKNSELQEEAIGFAHDLITSMIGYIRAQQGAGKIRKIDLKVLEGMIEESNVEL